MTTVPHASVDLDADTKENIAHALWMREYASESIPLDIIRRLGEVKNSRLAYGERMRRRLADLLANPESYTPDYTTRYTVLSDYAGELSARQAYVMTNLLGLDSARGYQELSPDITFHYPSDDRPQFEYQVGWHFYVGTAFGVQGQEFGIQFMFYSYSLLPPKMAEREGLSATENQIVEVHLAISAAHTRHYRITPVLVAGTTGLIRFSDNPYTYVVGKNAQSSLESGSLFPLRLQAWGIDRKFGTPVELAIDITLHQTKGYILNGEDGHAPSCGGVGTLYYSVPNLQVQPGESWLSIDGQKVPITGGKFWYDHQWGTGFMPQGSPRNSLLRGARILEEPQPDGWDWMPIQFDDDTEITLSALHSNERRAFYFQSGLNPPGIMVADADGSYIRKNGEYFPIKATLKVTDWVRSVESYDQYQASNTWYPNRVEVTVHENEVPEEKRHFVMVPLVKTGQLGFFAYGDEYSEGAVIIESPDGKRMGVGFLELISYADCWKQCLRLAGLPDTDDMVKLFKPAAVSDEMKAEVVNYLQEPENPSRLNDELAKCKGRR